eukprot:543600-Rhodomonas_salina.2
MALPGSLRRIPHYGATRPPMQTLTAWEGETCVARRKNRSDGAQHARLDAAGLGGVRWFRGGEPSLGHRGHHCRMVHS